MFLVVIEVNEVTQGMRTVHSQGRDNGEYEMSGGKEAWEEAIRIRKRAMRDYHKPRSEEFPKLHLPFLNSIFFIIL